MAGFRLFIQDKATELEMMISYVRAKIDWMIGGKQGRQPDFGSYVSQVTDI